MKINTVLIPLISLLFVGCTQIPPMNFTPMEISRANSRIDADLRSITVSIAQDNEKRGDIDFNFEYSKTVPDLWKTGLEDSLNRSLAFSDSGKRKVNLRVKILLFDMPSIGIEMQTDTVALYEIQDRESGDILFHEEVTSKGVVEATYAFFGPIRAMESTNRAVQNNVLAFIHILDQKGIKGIDKL